MTNKEELQDWMDEVQEKQSISDATLELKRLKHKLALSNKKIEELVQRLNLAEERESFLLELKDYNPDPIIIKPLDKLVKHEATAVALASDWHVEELVEPSTINGMNTYNTTIARQRSVEFFRGILWMIRNSRTGSTDEYGFNIKNLVLWLGGDLISGYIHEELMESNELSPTEATLFAQDLIVSGIDFLLKHGELEKIIIPCSYGNHGRSTIKRRHSTGAKNSYEWMMYQQLRRLYENEPRVEFVIADGAHVYLGIYDWTIRFHHGDDVKYGGGVGGLTVPLRKAVDSWNIGRYADITCIGHYHQFFDCNFAIVNGSLVGYGPFSLAIKARYEPPMQGFFLIDRDRGKRMVSPIMVDPIQRKMLAGRTLGLGV
jgi:hypothetical protein